MDIFCTWDAAPRVRQRLVERCGLICSGVDNDYMQDQHELAGHVENGIFCAVDHVESYATRPMTGVSKRSGYDYDSDDSKQDEGDLVEYSSDEYYKRQGGAG